ncbi:hypothetical protein [Streptomyces zagrosensis]|uniref:ARB-07466-like C-terminal domain-containing protein n=1 Tax=Streptomyces zagrosensis TaxID=1042984 RepID=A0A7W9QAN9_9ACTN|nr:hypothetical protein [Streptomyces zagrosensis]MBB5936758.1 hypothetical protein [Streptomyces zagrosensis]
MSLPFLSSRARRARAGVACAVLLALVGYAMAHLLTGGGGPPRCTVRADGERLELDPEQSIHAATISAVASSRGLPDRAVTIALATALQESGLHNIRRGDRDSLGLFQQRPSQGWGTAQQILDPVYSAGKFFDYLVKVPGYSRLPLTVAAQRVQFSGFPQAYAKHEATARLLTASLTGRLAASFRCPALPDDGEPGDPQRLRTLIAREFGPKVLASGAKRADSATPGTGNDTTGQGGMGEPGSNNEFDPENDPGSKDDGAAHHGAGARGTGGSTGDDGSTGDHAGNRGERETNSRGGRANPHEVDVLVRATTPGGDPQERGWEVAHWAMAHATELRIIRISFGDREWTASNSTKGWRTVSGQAAHSARMTSENSPTKVRIGLAR